MGPEYSRVRSLRLPDSDVSFNIPAGLTRGIWSHKCLVSNLIFQLLIKCKTDRSFWKTVSSPPWNKPHPGCPGMSVSGWSSGQGAFLVRRGGSRPRSRFLSLPSASRWPCLLVPDVRARGMALSSPCWLWLAIFLHCDNEINLFPWL